MKYDSKHYRNGKFYNLEKMPQWAEGYNFFKVLKEVFFKKTPHRIPEAAIPSLKTSIKELDINENVLIWFGHSSYFIQLEETRFLIDPVFSGSVSPVPGMMKAFKGSDRYSPDDMPEIDFLIITHDHYDHLDRSTILQLRSKVKYVICGLGVGRHFQKWGYEKALISEKDWYDSFSLNAEFDLHVLPARHFSGRGLKRNNTLWCSYLLQCSAMNIYLGGDSGYGKHFAEIGEKFESVDLAILENGQYNQPWHYIHMFPEETVQAAEDLHAKQVFPVHSSKFALSQHSWNEPLEQLSKLAEPRAFQLLLPKIGEKVELQKQQHFSKWWKSVD